jgi:NAD(P)-dependent dehydrogenase (short-subunit alcohol dehydrogenase family)
MPIASETRYDAASSQDLSGKVALVTGGTRGIGRGIAMALAAAGAQTIITGRDQANAETVVAEIVKAGGDGGYVVADLFDDDSVGSLVPDAIAKYGKLDILVNNAGIDDDALALGYGLDAWRKVMRFNLEVPFRLCQAAGEHFIENGGG